MVTWRYKCDKIIQIYTPTHMHACPNDTYIIAEIRISSIDYTNVNFLVLILQLHSLLTHGEARVEGYIEPPCTFVCAFW